MKCDDDASVMDCSEDGVPLGGVPLGVPPNDRENAQLWLSRRRRKGSRIGTERRRRSGKRG
jgi:hypothetical protein